MALAEFIAEQFCIRAVKEKECHMFREKIQAVSLWADKLADCMPDNSPLAINVKVKVKVAGKRACRIIKQLSELEDTDQTVEWLTSKSVKFTLARFSQTLDETYLNLYNELRSSLLENLAKLSLKEELQGILSTEFANVREAVYSPDDVESFDSSDECVIPFIALAGFAGAVRDLTSSVDSFSNSISELKPAALISNGVPLPPESKDIESLKSKIAEMETQIEELQKAKPVEQILSVPPTPEKSKIVEETKEEKQIPCDVVKQEVQQKDKLPIWLQDNKFIMLFLVISQVLLAFCLVTLIRR